MNFNPRQFAAKFIGARDLSDDRLSPRRTTGDAAQTTGNLEVSIAQSRLEIRQAQRLRYRVFYEELSAVPSLKARVKRRDEDAYDTVCDHLLVVDHAERVPGFNPWQRKGAVVGTYRLLRHEIADTHGFYTQGEYDLAPLIAAKSPDYKFLEVGRSCVLKPYRTKRTVELLWQGLWTYVREHGYDVMIGCASFAGIDPDAHAMALSFLHHHAAAPPDWRVSAHPHLNVSMDRLPKEEINARAALKALPPLIKGYLKLGAVVGDGAVIDHQFGTVDVLIVLPVERINPRYFSHFGAPDEKVSAQ